jgi:hypothetical protein
MIPEDGIGETDTELGDRVRDMSPKQIIADGIEMLGANLLFGNDDVSAVVVVNMLREIEAAIDRESKDVEEILSATFDG